MHPSPLGLPLALLAPRDKSTRLSSRKLTSRCDDVHSAFTEDQQLYSSRDFNRLGIGKGTSWGTTRTLAVVLHAHTALLDPDKY